MTTNESRGRSRKERPMRRLTDGMKKAIVYLVCVSLIGTSMLSSSVFADEDDSISDSGDVIVYLDDDGSVETGSNAARSGGSDGSSSVITADDVESAANAKKASIVYEEYADGITVSVEVPEGALPEGAELVVERYATGSDEFADAAEAIGREADDENMAAVDIHFELDGEEVEPSEEVTVSIDVSDILPEEADPASIVVTHLEEIESEEDDAAEDGESEIADLSLVETKKEVKPVVVANKKKGEIDKESAVAIFSVKSFSSFTITWAGNEAGENSTEVTVYLYDINGLGIYDEDEQNTYEWTSGVHTIQNLLEEHVSGKISEGYTYAYATVGYLTTSAMGGDVTTIGSADNPVVSVSWNGTNYTVTTSTGDTPVASSDADEFYINLYFSTPMVSISVTGADTTNHTVSLTADAEYFLDSDITYTWEITSGSDYASITWDGANATVTWNEGDAAGTDITVKVTATSASGETTTDSYALEYGMQQVTFTVYYGTTGTSGTLASGAHVAIYDESGNLVSNGETGENGQVTLWIVPGTTYKLEAVYTYSDGTGMATTYTHYTYENTEYVYNDEDETNIYLTTSDANFYEHVDVKLSIAEEDAGYSDILANVDYIKIYDEAGELVYQSSQMVHNEGTNDFNVLFADADGNEGDNPHSIAFYDTYSIQIAYEISYTYTDSSGNATEYTESYIATIDKDSTYVDGEYYSYNGTNAYQLYNTINGTDYNGTSFAAAVAASASGEAGGLENYNPLGISLDGLTYFYVAAALCDTYDTVGQAGLDLALGVNSLRVYSSTTWNFDVQKTLENSGAEAGAFTFGLYDATVDGSTWSINVSDNADENGLNFTLSNGTMTMSDGSTESVANMSGFFAFDFDSTMVGRTQTYYFVLLEDKGTDEHITYSNTAYGIRVDVTLNSSTDMNDVTIVENAFILNESESSDPDYRSFTSSRGYSGSANDAGYTIFTFVNYYDAINISGEKIWVESGSNAQQYDPVTILLYNNYDPDADENTPIMQTQTEYDEETEKWTWSFEGLPKYSGEVDANGDQIEITYTVLEAEVEGYIPSYEYTTDEDGNITVIVTNSMPTIDKYVRDKDENEEFTDTDDASNGDILEYELIADHIGNATSVVFHEFMPDQLHFESEDFEIVSITLYEDAEETIADSLRVEDEKGGDGDYWITTGDCTAVDGYGSEIDGSCVFEIHIEDDDLAGLGSDAHIVVEFDVDVEESISDFNENYVDEIENAVGLTFLATFGTPLVFTDTYSYGFDIYKYASDTEEALSGAEFVLSRDDTGEYAQFTENESTYLLTGWTESYEGDETTTITTGSGGNAVVEGLHDGTFTLTETEAPAGYKISQGTTTIVIYAEDDFSLPTITIDGADVDDATARISNDPIDEDDGTPIPEPVSVIGYKTWDDNDNEDGVRPESITINLMVGDEVIDSRTVTEADDWSWEFTGLDKYDEDGEEITYIIREIPVEGYTAVYDNGYNITNVHGPVVKSVDVEGSDVTIDQELTYTITATNNTTEDAKIVIIDTLPDTLELVSTTNEYEQTGQVITFTFENTAPGEMVSVILTARVVSSSGEVDNTATVDIGDNEYTTNTVTNQITPTSSTTTTHSPSSTTGGSGRNSGNSGPGSTGTVTEGEPSESSSTTINTDDIRALPYTGESNTAAILMGLCAVFVVLLGGLFYMRSKTPKEDE